MAPFRILVTDPIAEAGRELLASMDDLELAYRPEADDDAVARAVPEADGLIVRSGTRVTADLLERTDRLRAIVRAGVGVDNIDVEAATRRGVLVMNTPGGNTVAAAEHTIGLLLSLCRSIPAADRSVKAGEWERSRFVGVEVRGKTLGILGLGKIGREVARRAHGLDMEVCAHDPFVSPERAATLNVQLLEMEEVLERADVLTVHVPLSERTHHLIDEDEIARMKPGARIINCARGGVVSEEALARALGDGRLAGAALDVYETEPPEPTDLIRADAVVTTPHLGASTVEAQENVGTEAVRILAAYLREGAIHNAVNTISVDAAVLDETAPWRRLAARLGGLQAQLMPGGARLEGITVTFSGEPFGETERGLLTIAYLGGFLGPFLSEPVNEVNARHLAEARGIRLDETTSPDARGFTRLLEATVETSEGTRRVAGTLFGIGPRIVFIDDYLTDAVPEGTLILVSNDDRPGVIGRIGTLLGEHGINIANMFVGRQETGGRALGIVNVDTPASAGVLADLEDVSGILWAQQVTL